MSEVLFIVNNYKDGRLVVIGKVIKGEGGFIYEPLNLDKDDTPRWEERVRTTELPAIAKRRLFSERRPDIKEILERYGLVKYDAWELLKRTNGRLQSDDILYVTEQELEEMKKSVPANLFIGTEAAARDSNRMTVFQVKMGIS